LDNTGDSLLSFCEGWNFILRSGRNWLNVTVVCWQYVEELRASSAMWDHYEIANKSHVDISNVGEYFITAIETLLVSQRRMHIKVS